MKKILISIVIVLLIILAVFAITKGINFFNIKSVEHIKNANNKLEEDFNNANELSNKIYPEELEGLEEAIKKLKISKQEYENKALYNGEEILQTTTEIKTYKIHYLWIRLGNYIKDRGAQSLNLELNSTPINDVYDLQFTVLGSYTSIIDFLYDIENDEELNFEINNFEISADIQNTINNNQTNQSNNNIQNNSESNTQTQTNKTTTATTQTSKITKNNGIILKATFTVKSIGITLD